MLVVRQAVVGPFAENTWLIADPASGEAVVVDPGGDTARVMGMAHPGDFRIVSILATHGHVDHLAGVDDLVRRTGAPFHIHPADEPFVKGLPAQAAAFGFEPTRSPAVSGHLADRQAIRVGAVEGQVLHTPGHSPGSVCLWFPEERLLLTGDTLFRGSVGRTDLPGGDTAALVRSVRERIFPLGDDVRFYPGHGPAGRIGDERRMNPFVGDDAPRGRPP